MDLSSLLNPAGDTGAKKPQVPQRTASLAPPLQHHSPTTPLLQRQASLPTFPTIQSPMEALRQSPPDPHPFQEQSSSVSPKTVMSRKRSGSAVDMIQPPPPPKKRRHEIPIWAVREDSKKARQLKTNDRQPRHPSPLQQAPNAAAPPATAAPPPVTTPQVEATPLVERSLDNIKPYNDLVRVVANFLWESVILGPRLGSEGHVEIEAKLGTLIDMDTGERLNLPIRSEAVVAPSTGRTRFQSLMSIQQHKALNEYLNIAARKSLEGNRVPIEYVHLYEMDTLYLLPDAFISSLSPVTQEVLSRSKNRHHRVRVTRDQKTKEVKATIIKVRLADLEVYCPNDPFDYRISVAAEINYPHPIDGLVEYTEQGASTARGKDRLTYKHQSFQVDLTQVTQKTNASKIHELEVEMDVNQLYAQAALVQQNLPSQYEKYVKAFLNYVTVTRRAGQDSMGN
ncbi:mRNA triphosphatase CET1 [Trichodelitschia bisporula]|uniref:mRNA-capping enzyme subunit beta n=1 Tax=Trichodelitschia bisporula TaxID=703511 RepID=A0A6G1I3K1_9PEZI|nr:mRNA triphosphatase CET1 [Trichodelitschia bisporula]